MFTNYFFLIEGFKNLSTVGTITRTSKSITKKILNTINFEEAKIIVELGAGDGAITKYLLQHMRLDSQLVVFEVNPSFCAALKKIKDHRLMIINDSAENMACHLSAGSVKKVDTIISTLPFILFPPAKRDTILRQCADLLADSGSFFQLNYAAAVRDLYKVYFHRVQTAFIVWNMPPAYLFVCDNNI